MENPNYNCTQADLIVVIKTGLASAIEYLPRLTAFSPKYTLTYFNSLISETDAAAALPDRDARVAVSEMMRLDLVQKNREYCNKWQFLKRYISKVYKGEALQLQLNSAGQGYYTRAQNENWPSTRAMLDSASKYATLNSAELVANDNMPPTFPTQLSDALADFDTLVTAYESSKESILVATQLKIAALNAINSKFMEVMLDGQEIFKNEETIYKQFVFAEILSRVSGPGLAGLNGKVTDSATNLPIFEAHIKIFHPDTPETEYTGTTNEEGEYLVNCPSGTYTVTVAKAGYNPHTMVDMVVEVGTVSRVNVKLSLI